MKKKRKLSPITFINARITATISIAFVLFILGLIILLPLFSNELAKYVKEQLSFDITLKDNMSETQIQKLQKTLELAPFTKSTKYISKAEAAKNLEQELGQGMEDFLGFNPLPALIEVHLNSNYVNTDSIHVVEKFLSAYPNDIKEIEYRKDLMQKVSNNTKKIGILLLIIVLPLLFISFALINNTIRLMVYSKRFLIHAMQLVGAKKSFIRKPFVIANIWSGIIASLIANGLLYLLIYYLTNNMAIRNEFFNLYSLLITFGSVMILGILTATIATYFAVSKYIGADIDDLYKM